MLTSALNMLNAQPAEAKTTSHELEDGAEKAAMGASIAVVPLTIPLLTGPATMSTVVIYAEKAKTLLQLGTLVGYGVVIALATAVCFSLAEPIARVLGKTGINVMTRLMGLILAALAVEVMSAVIDPITRFARGAERVLYLSIRAVSSESLATVRLTMTLLAAIWVTSPVCRSMVR